MPDVRKTGKQNGGIGIFTYIDHCPEKSLPVCFGAQFDMVFPLDKVATLYYVL